MRVITPHVRYANEAREMAELVKFLPFRYRSAFVSLSQYQYLIFPFFFFFNDTATTEIYTLSLHDALPISELDRRLGQSSAAVDDQPFDRGRRSEEHTSELQSQFHLVCRLLLEKKKKN